MKKDITELFCFIDDFCVASKPLIDDSHQRKPTRLPRLTLSEMLTIVLLFHHAPCKNFKCFYKLYMPLYYSEFPKLPCYDRFIALMPRLLRPMTLLLSALLDKPTGISYIDSTSLRVCNTKRGHRHRVFEGLATFGRSSMGFFFGLKLHLVISHHGGLLHVKLTPGNTHDKTVISSLTQQLKGLLFGDKAYVDAPLFQQLFQRGLKLVTNVRRNMKSQLIPLQEKLLLKKRTISETVFDYLKNKFQIEHTRHRSPINACVHIISTLVAYQSKTSKPAINITG